MNLVCFTHPHYDGKSSPTLSCKTCCSIFIAAVRQHNSQQGSNPVDTFKWLENKVEEGRNAYKRAQAVGQSEAPRLETCINLIR